MILNRISGTLALVLALLMHPPALRAQEAEPAAPPRTTVLNIDGLWRTFYVLHPPVKREGEKVETVVFAENLLNRATANPPGDWRGVDFNDVHWPRVAGVQRSGYTSFDPCSPFTAMECRRGKFSVSDPARVKDLTLSLKYRGGAVIYLNGREVARSYMPAGEVTPDTLAEDYPLDAQQTPGGKRLSPDPRDKDKEILRRLALRNRDAADIKIPTAVLREGVNVLAIEIHRAPYAPIAVGKSGDNRYVGIQWGTCGLLDAELTASDADGLTPNVSRPKGFQVWNSDPMNADVDLDYGDPNETLRPVEIVSTRGGVASGKVLVGNTEAIRDVKAIVTDLTQTNGRGLIKADAVQVRCALPWGSDSATQSRTRYIVTRIAALAETPPSEVPVREPQLPRYHRKQASGKEPVGGAIVGIWTTVNVPADAEPGDYEGTLTVSADGINPVGVPLRLKVCAWTCPPPREFRAISECIQSPDTLALEYETPLWSDAHFALIDKSLTLLAGAGRQSVYVPLICETNLGNAESMVRWKKKAEGGYDYDFAILNRYLDLVEKRQGKPLLVCLIVWDTFLEGGKFTGHERYVPKEVKEDRDQAAGKGPEVTLVDENGEISKLTLPLQSDPASRDAWKPMLDALRKHLNDRGLQSSIMLGFVTDTRPTKEIAELYRELMPGVAWLQQSHGPSKDLHGVPFAYHAYVWTGNFVNDPKDKPELGWSKESMNLFFPRAHMDPFPMTTHRFMAELCAAGDERGFGRIGGDFWPVLRDKRGERIARISEGRYPRGSWRALNIVSSMLAPGPDGPVATVRFEIMREGLQECQARIFIESVMIDENKRAKLGDDLARRAQETIDEHTVAMLQGTRSFTLGDHFTSNCENRHIWWEYIPDLASNWFICSSWRERTERLFSTAAEVARILDQP